MTSVESIFPTVLADLIESYVRHKPLQFLEEVKKYEPAEYLSVNEMDDYTLTVKRNGEDKASIYEFSPTHRYRFFVGGRVSWFNVHLSPDTSRSFLGYQPDDRSVPENEWTWSLKNKWLPMRVYIENFEKEWEGEEEGEEEEEEEEEEVDVDEYEQDEEKMNFISESFQ